MSSNNEYTEEKKLIEKDYVLKIFDEQYAVELQSLIKFNNEYNDDKCLEVEEKKKKYQTMN